MATKKIQSLSLTERVAARKQARINKAQPPAPRFVATPKKTTTPPPAKATETRPVDLSMEDKVKMAKEDSKPNKSFEDRFLSIVSFLPPEQQGRAYSLFSVFRSLPEAEQETVMDELMKSAEATVGPGFNLLINRFNQDRQYEKTKISRELGQSIATYDKLIADTDFRLLHDKAKEDRQLSRTIRDLTNDVFVGRVSQSGLLRRRIQDQMDPTEQAKLDLQRSADKIKSDASFNLGNIQANAAALLGRQDVLSDRLVEDKKQEQEVTTDIAFLDLFKNQYEHAAEQNRDNISFDGKSPDSPDSLNAPGRVSANANPGTTMADRAALRGANRQSPVSDSLATDAGVRAGSGIRQDILAAQTAKQEAADRARKAKEDSDAAAASLALLNEREALEARIAANNKAADEAAVSMRNSGSSASSKTSTGSINAKNNPGTTMSQRSAMRGAVRKARK